ncbi:hypothetical protein PPACK8108_LOCUS20642 [Phakopsora pachyrhizi]|uniref:Uncharacterized protein n=1 Tax=Phakopsora pachyrhizi TaxID=170000 RepID=A0AAV0BIV2_PHAPC|nr:hypothetical protein PPACK8108_LOCUS20642 [Phakopsora pachyrhizi]
MVVVDLDDAEVKLEMISEVMDRETDEIDLPQNSDCSKLGDQNNKMNEEEESEVLMVRLKEGLKEAMRS